MLSLVLLCRMQKAGARCHAGTLPGGYAPGTHSPLSGAWRRSGRLLRPAPPRMPGLWSLAASVVIVAEVLTAVEAELARLRTENARLLRLLKMTPQQAAPPGPGQAGFFEAPPGLVDDGSPPEVKVAFYGALFTARTDAYAIRYDNPRTGRGGWVPAVRGGWQLGQDLGTEPQQMEQRCMGRCREVPRRSAKLFA